MSIEGLYWSYIGIMGKKMETTISDLGFRAIPEGLKFGAWGSGFGFKLWGLGLRVGNSTIENPKRFVTVTGLPTQRYLQAIRYCGRRCRVCFESLWI